MDTDIAGLVDADRGLIGRRIFIGPDVYQQELEQIFARCPALAADTDGALEIIYSTEFILRELRGEEPTPEEYYARFPQHRQRLEELFRLHQLVGGADEELDSPDLLDLPVEDGTDWGVEHFEVLEALGQHGPVEERERRTLAADVTELQVLATHLPFDTSNLQPRRIAVRALQDRLALVLPLISALEDRLGALRRLNAMPSHFEALVRDVATFFRNADSTSAEAEALKARSLASIPALREERGRVSTAVNSRALVRLAITNLSVEDVDRAKRLHISEDRSDEHRDEVSAERDRAESEDPRDLDQSRIGGHVMRAVDDAPRK